MSGGNGPTKCRVHVVMSQKASQDAGMQESLRVLVDRGHQVESLVATDPEEAVKGARGAALAGADRIVAAGGDGIINLVINGISDAGLEGKAVIGVIPFGTANDFASACGIPTANTLEALVIAAEAEPILIDVGRANGRLFVNVASGGFPAEITTDTPVEVKETLGGFAYFLTGLAKATDVTAQVVRVRAPGVQWEGLLLAMAVGNGRQAGGGFRICPHALLNDGLLDLLIIPEVAREQLVLWVRDLLRLGKTFDHSLLTYAQVPWVEVDAPEGLQINLDGEPVRGSSFRFEVLARQLPFALPSGAPLRALDGVGEGGGGG